MKSQTKKSESENIKILTEQEETITQVSSNILDIILKYFSQKDILELSLVCSTLRYKIQNSFYQQGKKMLIDCSIYSDHVLVEKVLEYTALGHYVYFQIERPCRKLSGLVCSIDYSTLYSPVTTSSTDDESASGMEYHCTRFTTAKPLKEIFCASIYNLSISAGISQYISTVYKRSNVDVLLVVL
jgi:hypothetical protein